MNAKLKLDLTSAELQEVRRLAKFHCDPYHYMRERLEWSNSQVNLKINLTNVL